MVQTHSQQIRVNMNPENIISLIQITNINDQNRSADLVYDQHASETQVLHGASHSHDCTHTTTPMDYNYPNKDVTPERGGPPNP